ncbi:acyl carrier protein [Crossiella equi]|uniref:Acyl carrier protein n=1 Tax=Crossiella equi TaxID=130796 RepID=A0ABS5A6T6_9PSEU|nr:acyl carrier protein [Crossiella equi]MBP2471924.1 acyl carrier protein [Crossiella equi]
MEKQVTGVDESTLNKLVAMILDGLEWPSGDAPPGAETHIGEEGLGMDSLMVVELALDIEEEFGFEIDEEEMFEIGAMTLGRLADFVDDRATRGAVT